MRVWLYRLAGAIFVLTVLAHVARAGMLSSPGHLMGPGPGVGSPSPPTNHNITTEAGVAITTEAGVAIRTEQ
jgi:hypothetical protein